jgi:peptidoglycan/LPS O-acetylase OafA/YrhL
MTLLTLVSVLYLGVTATVAVATGLGAPLHAATRTGYAVGRALGGLCALLDSLSLVRGHRPAELATHVGYVVCAVVLPPVVTGRRTSPWSPWLVALACVATAIVLVRMAQTWA